MKLLLSVLMLVALGAPAFADTPEEPKWASFCPPEYVDAQPGPPAHYHREQNNILTAATVGITYPFSYYIKKHAEHRDEVNYWAKRRPEFDLELANCRLIEDVADKGICYNDIKKAEALKNETHRKDIQSNKTYRRTK